MPREKRSWKRRPRGLASSVAHSLRTLVGISSGPDALPGSRLRRMFLTSLGLKWTLPMEDDGNGHCGRGCTDAPDSVHFFAKVWQKMLTFSLSVM